MTTEDPFLVAAVLDASAPDVFTVVAYRPQDQGLLAEQFPGREVRMLDRDVLSEHAQAEVRRLFEVTKMPDTVLVGTTDGQGGWASWKLAFFAPAPGPVPKLPERGGERL